MSSSHAFSWGAHVLLWVFPLLLTVVALALHWVGDKDKDKGGRS